MGSDSIDIRRATLSAHHTLGLPLLPNPSFPAGEEGPATW